MIQQIHIWYAFDSPDFDTQHLQLLMIRKSLFSL